MTIKLIRTSEEHEAALARVLSLMECEMSAAQEEELEILVLLIERYEEIVCPIEKVDPITALKFRMEQQGLSQSDLVPMIGSASRVSEVLAGKRGLSLNMIRGLVRGLGMSADVLIGDFEPKRTVPARTVRKKKDDGRRARPPSSRRSSISRGRRK